MQVKQDTQQTTAIHVQHKTKTQRYHRCTKIYTINKPSYYSLFKTFIVLRKKSAICISLGLRIINFKHK